MPRGIYHGTCCDNVLLFNLMCRFTIETMLGKMRPEQCKEGCTRSSDGVAGFKAALTRARMMWCRPTPLLSSMATPVHVKVGSNTSSSAGYIRRMCDDVD